MRLPNWLRKRLLDKAIDIAGSRKPDFIIGGGSNPYLLRWWVIPRNRWFNIYLHQFRRSDDDRALHTHPWWSCSLLLHGSYLEHLEGDVMRLRREGSINARGPDSGHRVQLMSAPWGGERMVWTFFITGPKVREWFFLCPQGKVHWRKFTKADAPGEIGPGCAG